MSHDWVCVPRAYEVSKNHLQSYKTYDHPLKLSTVTVIDSKGTRGNLISGSNGSSHNSSNISVFVDPLGSALEGSDPLSQFARQEQELNDPLSQMATEYASKTKTLEKQSIDNNEASSLNWSSKRLGILNRFTTSEKLSISTSFLTTGITGIETIKSQTVVSDKVKFRLEQLDNFEDSSMRHMMDLTQQEYIQRIEQLNQELVQSWNNDQRVKALKIAIQCSKMLSDTTVLSFYPSQFVLITDLLDMFGKLVYDRLQLKANSTDDRYVKRIVPIVTTYESARATCQNWFFKIASIREVLPRLYVEMAIIKCYEFLSQAEFDQALMRLTKMIRGIGDPLVAAYARCYLIKVGLSVTQQKDYILENFQDFLFVYHTIFNGGIRAELNRQRITINTYLALFSPALDFILQALIYNSNIHTEAILRKCKDIKNNGALMMSVLNAFKPEFIAANAMEFVQTLSNISNEDISKSHLFRALGSSVSSCAPLQEHRVPLLNSAFFIINTLTDPTEYINCTETWTQFIAENFTMHELNMFLGQISVRMSQGKAFEKHYSQLQNVIDKMIQYCKNIELLLVQDNFLPFLDLFQKNSIKIEVCKNILNHYKTHSQLETGDSIVTNAMMYIGRILNDSVNALTVEDESRQIAQLISCFIRKVNYGRDFEQQLSFYVEARGTFANLDGVYITLVHCVNKLAIETRRIMDGRHNRKTMAFVKACIAFCFITIPSISLVQMQMDLYFLTGQVALLNLCLGQADACFEAAIQLVPELPRSIEIDGKIKSLETYLVSYLCNIMATLVVVPDSPEQGVLYLLRLLLDVTNKYPFEENSTGPSTIYLNTLDMLYVQSLEEFPYHIPNVVSNDELYGHDRKFLAEVNNMCNQTIEKIFIRLKVLGQSKQFRVQVTLALELLIRIVRYSDLSQHNTFKLALNLWLLAIKLENHVDKKQIARTLQYVEDFYKLIECDDERSRAIASLIKCMQG